MKFSSQITPFLIALIAAVGNAFVTVGQKKAGSYSNPFLFGAFSLLIASLSLFTIAAFYPASQLREYFTSNLKWFAVTALGLGLLNIFLFFLYRNFGASYYTLYSILAIITTSIFVSIFLFGEKMNSNYAISLVFAFCTIYFFMRGKLN